MDPYGSYKFSGKEKAVIDLLLQGKSNKQIALALGVTVRTVEFHLGNIYAKFGVSSRSEAILLLTKKAPNAENHSEAAEFRESTVAPTVTVADNDPKALSSRRFPMRKAVFILFSLLIGGFALVFILSKIGGTRASIALSPPDPTASGEPSAAGSSFTPPPDPTNAAAQPAGSSGVRLSVDWFYIDDSRAYLEISVCGLLVPEGSRPIHVIDAAKVAIYRADGSPLDLAQHTAFGGGSGGEEPAPEEKPACFRETFDYALKQPQTPISPEEMFTLEIPVGGPVLFEDGNNRTLPSAAFRLEQKPTYTRPLTFVLQKTAQIEDKTVTFDRLELNPASAAVTLCILDPAGEQWLPAVSLIYRGSIVDPSSSGLTDGSNGDATQALCYRLNYQYPFHPEAGSDPETDLSVLLTKLTKDQPERLPYELIARAQNQLAAQGIEFSYVIVNHGADILITKKPENLTDAEALRRINEALTSQAIAPGGFVFTLKDALLSGQ